MKKEISPVTAAIVIAVVVAVLAFIGWRYFFAEPEPVINPAEMPVGGPGVAPPGMAPTGPGGPPTAPQGAPVGPR